MTKTNNHSTEECSHHGPRHITPPQNPPTRWAIKITVRCSSFHSSYTDRRHPSTMIIRSSLANQPHTRQFHRATIFCHPHRGRYQTTFSIHHGSAVVPLVPSPRDNVDGFGMLGVHSHPSLSHTPYDVVYILLTIAAPTRACMYT